MAKKFKNGSVHVTADEVEEVEIVEKESWSDRMRRERYV